MDLFTKADKQKEFPDSNTVLIHLKSNGKFNVTIHDNFLTVEPRGFTNAVNKGLIGQKTYDLNNVSGVQYKKPGFTTGYLQIVLIGGRDARNGVSGAVKDENSITFSKKEDHLILEIKEYIENYIHEAPLVPLQPLILMKYESLKSCLILEQSQMRNLKPKRLSCLTFKEITKSPGILPGPFCLSHV